MARGNATGTLREMQVAWRLQKYVALSLWEEVWRLHKSAKFVWQEGKRLVQKCGAKIVARWKATVTKVWAYDSVKRESDCYRSVGLRLCLE